MGFERVVELANGTPTSVLCEAWGASPEYVTSRKRAEFPMSLREAGDLAEVHGMNLLDVLSL
ncbi:hypothetical protein AHiyo6_03930 [Arthrobacter sp. Hiyo6]|nr:hypothetical protein AHiyo6_03930 [Arthrobacter sp. Hiyo6]